MATNGGGPAQQEKEKKWYNHCKSWAYHNNDNCYTLEKNKQNHPLWYNNLMNPNGTEKGEPKNDGSRSPTSTIQSVIAEAT